MKTNRRKYRTFSRHGDFLFTKREANKRNRKDVKKMLTNIAQYVIISISKEREIMERVETLALFIWRRAHFRTAPNLQTKVVIANFEPKTQFVINKTYFLKITFIIRFAGATKNVVCHSKLNSQNAQ